MAVTTSEPPVKTRLLVTAMRRQLVRKTEDPEVELRSDGILCSVKCSPISVSPELMDTKVGRSKANTLRAVTVFPK